ncbi:MAG TPA: DinB family protein [Streptosporangiaceae bacterium]|jgi:hypothetical protein
MTESQPTVVSPMWDPDPRIAPGRLASERELLTSFLDWHRATFELKCTGVAPERLSDRGSPPSTTSLHGILRHLAGGEGWWFGQQFAGEGLWPAGVTPLYTFDDDPDADFEDLGGDPAVALATWHAACQRSRRIVAAAESLDQTGATMSGQPFTLRWLLLHTIAEYARHNGQADLLREAIDGATGM